MLKKFTLCRLKVENMTFLIAIQAFKIEGWNTTYYDNVKFMINTIYHLYKNEWKSQIYVMNA